MTGSGGVTEHALKTARHTTYYLMAGPENGVPMIFVHGWPELSISWRHVMPVFAGLGLRAIAPDMRGYGRSSTYPRHEDYALELIVADMIELLDELGAEKAIWVGHDWGSPVVWAIAQAHPERVHGVASLCVPYMPDGFRPENSLKYADRSVYPEDKFPNAQWDYQFHYRDSFAQAQAEFEADIRATVKTLFRRGNPAARGKPVGTSMTRANKGWFGPKGAAGLGLPRDETVLTQEDEDRYTAALTGSGFFGPGSWYMNAEANSAFAQRNKANWRLSMPVLFLHGAYDYVCETLDSRLAEPMRENCSNLTEGVVATGHWMAQERPRDVSAALAKWLAAQLPDLWPAP